MNATYQYSVKDKNGNYLGELTPYVTSDFDLQQTINSVGSQLQIVAKQSTDVASLQTVPITDESGTPITDEAGNTLLADRQNDIVGIPNALINNDNLITVTEISDYHPNGVVVYSGYISYWEDDDATDEVTVTCLNLSQDLNNYLIPGANSLFVDQSYTAANNDIQSMVAVSSGHVVNGTFWFGFYFTVTQDNVAALEFNLANDGGGDVVPICQLWANEAAFTTNGVGALAAANAVVPNNASLATYRFTFPTPVNVTPGTTLFVTLGANYNGGGAIDFYGNTSGGSQFRWVIASGLFSTGWQAQTFQVWFKEYYSKFTNTNTFTDEDPSAILTTIMSGYQSSGGAVATMPGGFPNTGDSITYAFKLNTILEGIQKIASLGPTDFYYFVDPATNVLYYQAPNTVADFILVKGRHITNLKVRATKEGLINLVYFSGGDDGTGTQTNVLAIVANTLSQVANRIGLARIADNRVSVANLVTLATAVATGTLIAQNYMNSNSGQAYIATCTVLAKTMDISLFKIGMMVGFAGNGNYRDSLLLPIVGIHRTGEMAQLSLGTLPKRGSKVVEQINGYLNDLQTVDTSNVPS